MIVFRVEYGTPIAGRCSLCDQPFEVELDGRELLIQASEKLNVMFEAHMCNEDASQAAPRAKD